MAFPGIRWLFWTSVAALSALGFVVAMGAWFLASIPDGRDLRNCLTTTMFHVYLCPSSETYVPLKLISVHARNAVVVSEDGMFWTHEGLDWDELRDSLEKNWETGKFSRGGSTITQQLAKNVYLSAEKSIFRKLKEAIIAWRLERLYTKDFILERYLNVVEFGPGIYGIKAAAMNYFKIAPSQLSPAQSAFLAFLLPNPKAYSRSFREKKLSPFAARQSRTIVERLFARRQISEEVRDQSLLELNALFGIISPVEKKIAPTVGEPEPADKEVEGEDSESEQGTDSSGET